MGRADPQKSFDAPFHWNLRFPSGIAQPLPPSLPRIINLKWLINFPHSATFKSCEEGYEKRHSDVHTGYRTLSAMAFSKNGCVGAGNYLCFG